MNNGRQNHRTFSREQFSTVIDANNAQETSTNHSSLLVIACMMDLFDRILCSLHPNALRGYCYAGHHFRSSRSLAWILVHALETYPLKEVSVCFFPEGHGKGAVDGHCGCMRHWVNFVAGTKVISTIDAHTKCPDATELHRSGNPSTSCRLPKTDIPSNVYDTVSSRQAAMGIKANYAWSSKLVGKAPMVYCHGVTGKAASKHWRPACVAATGADSDDDAVTDVSGQWRARADIVGSGHAAHQLEVHAKKSLEWSSLQNAY